MIDLLSSIMAHKDVLRMFKGRYLRVDTVMAGYMMWVNQVMTMMRVHLCDPQQYKSAEKGP